MRWTIFLGILPLVGCGTSSLPMPGDVVAPRLVESVIWQPGGETNLFVELAATNKAGESRRLGFAASPTHNPVATVVFYDEIGEQIGNRVVELSQRC